MKNLLTAPIRALLRGNDNRIRAPSVKAASGPPGRMYGVGRGGVNTSAEKLSAVYAAVTLRSNDMSVLPAYIMDTRSREHENHPLLHLLNCRPNEAMSASDRKRLIEKSILLTGNAYDWIVRDPRSARPVELIPLPGNLVTMWLDEHMRPWYDVTNPVTGERVRLPAEDVCHHKGPSRNGFLGESVLSYANDTIRAGLAAQEFNASFYEGGCHVSGVLTLEGDLSGYVKDPNGQNTDKRLKDRVREEWEKTYSGPTSAFRVAVLDHGMKYQPLAVSQKDSEFIQQQNVTVEDIARFFCVPLYKLQAGKQSYNSNEQNAVEYRNTLQPRVTALEEEQTWKLLLPSERERGLEIRYNMRALLRSDDKSRAEYYRIMKETGAYSINDILALEDMPDTPGGDEHFASLNYVPLRMWPQLSIDRNRKEGEKET